MQQYLKIEQVGMTFETRKGPFVALREIDLEIAVGQLLLDTLVDVYGGSGKVFDWSVIPEELASRVVLSGGLNVAHVTDAVRLVRPHAVDVSSGIECAPGHKDGARMQQFVEAVRAADRRAVE